MSESISKPQSNSAFGNISTDEVFTEIGRLYLQLVTTGKELSQLSKSLADANARNHQLENAMNQRNLEGQCMQAAQQQ